MEEKAKILNTETLSKVKYHLKQVTFELKMSNGKTQKQVREVYDRGNAATILLFNPDEKKIILTKQFRIPTFLNGNKGGMLVEACAGLLDEDQPEECVRKEAEEETGYRVRNVKKIFEAYMSPGSVTEMIHFFIGEYSKDQKVGDGGGLKSEGEDIEVLEIPCSEAYSYVEQGKTKDAKTIILLQHARLMGII